MKKKRQIKLLMSYGWSRNEAVDKAEEDRWFAHMARISGMDSVPPIHFTPTLANPYPLSGLNIKIDFNKQIADIIPEKPLEQVELHFTVEQVGIYFTENNAPAEKEAPG